MLYWWLIWSSLWHAAVFTGNYHLHQSLIERPAFILFKSRLFVGIDAHFFSLVLVFCCSPQIFSLITSFCWKTSRTLMIFLMVTQSLYFGPSVLSRFPGVVIQFHSIAGLWRIFNRTLTNYTFGLMLLSVTDVLYRFITVLCWVLIGRSFWHGTVSSMAFVVACKSLTLVH